MAEKQYAQTIQRALDDEIAALLTTQEREEAPRARRSAPPRGAASPLPPPAPPPPSEIESLDELPTLSDSAPPRQQQAFGGAAPGAYAPPTAVRAPAPAAAPLPDQHTTLVNLDQRIGRLIQVRDWIQEDGDIARLIDTVIGKQVQSSERRQARLSVALNVIFLLAGWVLSLIAAPTAIGHIFGH